MQRAILKHLTSIKNFKKWLIFQLIHNVTSLKQINSVALPYRR